MWKWQPVEDAEDEPIWNSIEDGSTEVPPVLKVLELEEASLGAGTSV